MEEKINIEEWKRREIFDFFGKNPNPFFSVTFTQDVTKLYKYTKKHGLSFYYSLVYFCTKAMNSVDAFNYVIRNGEVYKVDGRTPSFTDLRPGSDCFYIVTCPCDGSLADFCENAERRSAEQTAFIDSGAENDRLIYFSCLPWLDVTSVSSGHGGEAAKEDSVPLVTWGKYTQNNGSITLGMTVEVNHRLADGVHVGKFARELSRLTDNLNL